MNHQQGGFTLIEIAIVLVIIGLILGGALKGQELITSAKIRNIANDLNGISAAYYSYTDRYRAIPGDDKNAGETTGRWVTTKSGGGDGAIAGLYNSATVTDESRLFWHHLRLSGLITGAPDTLQPANAVGGMTGVQNGGLALSGPIVCTANLAGKIANAIDSQLDDGNPATGQVRGTEQSGSNDTLPTTNATLVYTDDGSKTYTVCKTI